MSRMDRHLVERMVGAAVLLLALIIIAPVILDGGDDAGSAGDGSAPEGGSAAMKTHTIRLGQTPRQPPVARPVVTDSGTASDGDAGTEAPGEVPGEAAAEAESGDGLQETVPEPPAAKPVKVSATPADEAPEPAPPKKPAPAVKAGWAVQLGAFSRQESARKLVAEVGRKGFSAYVVPVSRSDRTLYRVRVGPEETRSQADRLARRLAAAGHDGQVTPQKPRS